MISGLLKHLAQSRCGLQRMNLRFCRPNIAMLIVGARILIFFALDFKLVLKPEV
jgi:hypothetical protein